MKFDPMQLIWLFFMLSALQPVIKQRLLEATRKRLIAQIELKRKSRLVLLVHRQETMSLLGFPIMRYVDVNDSEDVIRAIHLTDPEIPLALVLHTPGGLVLAATQIARAVFKHIEGIPNPRSESPTKRRGMTPTLDGDMRYLLSNAG